jgi:hypothetical protein
MSKFSIGDKVKFKEDYVWYDTTGAMASGINLKDELGSIDTIKMVMFTEVYVVIFDNLPLGTKVNCLEDQLEATGHTLGSGLKSWLGTGTTNIYDDCDFLCPVIRSVERKCDCGGFKTYNSMSQEHHSSWCSSRDNKGTSKNE